MSNRTRDPVVVVRIPTQFRIASIAEFPVALFCILRDIIRIWWQFQSTLNDRNY
jgi:hypothetical protein